MCLFFMPIPHSFYYYGFVVCIEIRECDASRFVLSQDCSPPREDATMITDYYFLFVNSLEILAAFVVAGGGEGCRARAAVTMCNGRRGRKARHGSAL